MIDFKKFNSIISLTSYFTSNKKCEQAIMESRWSDSDVVCPYCGKHHCKMSKNGRFHCTGCNKNFSCLVGTIFENTKLPLIKWFVAMYLISSHKKGISSHQLSRDIEVTQSTAWYMLQKIRMLYPQSDSEAFEGTVECDEVYIGGREKWKHKSMRTPHTQGRSTKTKTPVFGMMERSTYVNDKGEEEPITYVHAFVVENTNRTTLQPIIQQFIEDGSRVITDELSAYNGLSALGYTHAVVNHGAEEYADGDVFTNSIEGFWSHFRRMITGCYHDVSDEHLQSYIDEAVYRWNTRKAPQSERFEDMFDKSIGLVRKWSEIRIGLMAA
ncbi:MAG: IS1595 family transposase [Prevotella sp.]|nr:IS1595 family transposase [Prevotella sp.]MBR6138154.1 IS1595 family transposase [Prevotella sp.]